MFQFRSGLTRAKCENTQGAIAREGTGLDLGDLASINIDERGIVLKDKWRQNFA
jgi:hypothetical protein